jgi:carbon starvation protein CstA
LFSKAFFKKSKNKAYLPALIDCAFRICLLTYAILYQRGILFKTISAQIDAIYQPVAEVLMVLVFWVYLLSAIRKFKKREPETPGIDHQPLPNI